MIHRTLRIHPADDVLVALLPLETGERILDGNRFITILEPVRQKHKVAARDLAPDEPVHMYGVLIGRAVTFIPAGGLLTTKNLVHAAAPFQRRAGRPEWSAPDVARWRNATFDGYLRSDGRVGTANHWLVIPLVFCENRNVEAIREALADALGYGKPSRYRLLGRRLVDTWRQGAGMETLLGLSMGEEATEPTRERVFPRVDGIKFLTHQSGCGEGRPDSEMLVRLLAAYIAHPNTAGATVLSLGCQNAQVRLLEEALDALLPAGYDRPLHILEQQVLGFEERLVTEAIRKTFVGLIEANQAERTPAPLDRLVIGMECGGSDGFSGLSANPAMGHAADLLVALGGSVLLSEFPELCGVEQDLVDRCIRDESAEQFMTLQRAYAARAEADGAGFDMNPSPGNIRDGLLTDAMKSAGAAKKGGTSPVVDVLDYAERVRLPGLSLLNTPGGDVESTTGLAAAGANVILFSTGLGTPTGNPITPVIKVSSNSDLARRMADLIDVDAGPILTGQESIEEVGRRLLETCIEVASGREVPRAVRLGQDDFIPWKRGISL